MIRSAYLAASLTCLMAVSGSALAQFPVGNSPNPLFSQYVTQGAGASSAAAYPAPHWSPLLGGQSYYTYQPLMPHEMMYQHSRNYYNYYNGGYYGGGQGVVKTSVRWQAGNNHVGPLPFSKGLSGVGDRLKSRRYGLESDAGGRGIGGGCRGCGPRLRGHGLGSCQGGSCATEGDAVLGDHFEGVTEGCASGTCTAQATQSIIPR